MHAPRTSHDVVRYSHRGRVVDASWESNSQTLLQHLREERRLCGTKEGCAEGDCGACVVIIGELAGTPDKVLYRAVNACIFPLSAMEGRQLITVEDLSSQCGTLHPVQEAMVQCHGSQCGFCTPGFVMSLYDLYLNHIAPATPTQIHAHLAGNLCRCTGYAPIIRAAEMMYNLPRQDPDVQHDAALLLQIDGSRRGRPKILHSRGETAAFPRTVQEAADLYLENPDAILLGGSTDVGLWITKQKRTIQSVIHLTRVREMCTASVNQDGLTIGAAMRLTDAMREIVRSFPEFTELCSRFASPPVRNMATLGGNIGNGSPIGDSMPALIAVGATVTLRRGSELREISLESLYLGYQHKDLLPGEFLQSVHIPVRQPNTFVRAYKVSKRFDDDISAVCCALAIHVVNGYCISVKIAYGGMGATPKRATYAETALTGRSLDRESMEHAANALREDFEPMSDHRASSWYRTEVAANLLRRAGEEYVGTQRTRVIDYVGDHA